MTLQYRKRFQGRLIGTWKSRDVDSIIHDFLASSTAWEGWTIEIRWGGNSGTLPKGFLEGED